MSAKRWATLVVLLVTLGAVALQFAITIPLRLANGDSLPGALIFFFSFFTILSNLMVCLIYLSDLSSGRWLGWWRSAATRGMMVGCIVLVGGFYHLVLAALWAPQGLAWVADFALHTIDPILYVVWWVAVQKHGGLRLGQLPAMLIFPLVYLAWALARGAVIGEYPYPVLEANRIGYPAVAVNCLSLLAVLLLLYAATVAADRWLARIGRG